MRREQRQKKIGRGEGGREKEKERENKRAIEHAWLHVWICSYGYVEKYVHIRIKVRGLCSVSFSLVLHFIS